MVDKQSPSIYKLLQNSLEHELVILFARFPDIFVGATGFLKPHMIADFICKLADSHDAFYNSVPILKAETKELSEARIALTDSVRIVIRNALNLMGIYAPERM